MKPNTNKRVKSHLAGLENLTPNNHNSLSVRNQFEGLSIHHGPPTGMAKQSNTSKRSYTMGSVQSGDSHRESGKMSSAHGATVDQEYINSQIAMLGANKQQQVLTESQYNTLASAYGSLEFAKQQHLKSDSQQQLLEYSGGRDNLNSNRHQEQVDMHGRQLQKSIEDTLNSPTDWINIQSIVKMTIRNVYELIQNQGIRMDQSIAEISRRFCTPQDLSEALENKPDIDDVRQVVSELMQATTIDHRPEIEELKRALQARVSKSELGQTLKAQTAVIEELRKEQNEFKSLLSTSLDELSEDRTRMDDFRKDANKNLTQAFRELEKLQLSIERKVCQDVFNERIESKADKQLVLNAVMNKVSKIEVEQALVGKCDKRDFDLAIRSLEHKLEEELISLNETVAQKASLGDMQYYQKELNFKLDKSELEAFRQDFVDRVMQFDQKLFERNQLLQQFGEALENKVECQLNEYRQQTQSILDKKLDEGEFHTLKQDMRSQFENLNGAVTQGWQEQQSQFETLGTNILKIGSELEEKHEFVGRKIEETRGEFTKLQDSLTFLMKERAEDLHQIGELLKNSARQTITEVLAKTEEDLGQRSREIENLIQNVRQEVLMRIDKQIEDKVKVEEVQDALKRLNSGFQTRIDQLQEKQSLNLQIRNEESLLKMNQTFEMLQTQIKELQLAWQQVTVSEGIQVQVQQLQKEVVGKADKWVTLQNLELLNDSLTSLSKEMLLKASINDVMGLLEKKQSGDEVQTELGHLKQTIQKCLKDFKTNQDDQNVLNEVLCAENCVARWLWKNGAVETQLGVPNILKWDLESVNTCPENYQWNLPGAGGQCAIYIEAPGLYELTFAFFSKKKKPLFQVLANNEVILQTFLPAPKQFCDSCGTQQQHTCQTPSGHGIIQKLPNGLLKVSAIEFVALPSKSVIKVSFRHQQSKKQSLSPKQSSVTQTLTSIAAEGFIGLRKL